MTLVEPRLKIAFGPGPICPRCREDGFDDWWHERGLERGVGIVAIQGRLKCHGCGKFFRVEKYHDDKCHCTARAVLSDLGVEP